MTAKTCGTCKSYNPDRMWCEFVLPISIVDHTRHMMYLTSKYPPCPAHTERESFCEWEYSEDVSSHITSCGEEFVKESEGPLTEYDYKFCPNCGKPIKIKENEA